MYLSIISNKGVGFLKNWTIPSAVQACIRRWSVVTIYYVGAVKKSSTEGILEKWDFFGKLSH